MNPIAITLTVVVMDLPDHGKKHRNWGIARALTRHFRQAK
jgi:hypothetical protein